MQHIIYPSYYVLHIHVHVVLSMYILAIYQYYLFQIYRILTMSSTQLTMCFIKLLY